MTQSTEQERAAFESWANGRCELHLVNPAGRYSSTITQFAWEAWQAARRAPAVPVPHGYKITEDQHVAAVKVLQRASGVDGLPQRMLDAMLAAAPKPPEATVNGYLAVEATSVQKPSPAECNTMDCQAGN